MNQRRALKFILPLVLCAAVLGVFVTIRGLEAAPAPETRQAGGITMSGFDVGTKITYHGSAAGIVTEGSFEIDGKGFARLPALEIPKDSPPGPLTYTITIEAFDEDNGGKAFHPVKITISLDETDGGVSVRGEGFNPFAGATMYKDDIASEMKADWAGILAAPDVSSIDVLQGPQTLKLAFQGFGSGVDDATEQSPSIIEVQQLMTPGIGGGPTNLGVNSYSPTGCSGETEHSICDEDAIDRTIEDIVEFVVEPMIAMGAQLSQVMQYWTEPLGEMITAKAHMEVLRKQQELRAEAVKDYHPSETMCRFGSFIKSVAQTEEKAHQTKQALSRILTERYSATDDMGSAEGYNTDVRVRLIQFRRIYCDPMDNNNGLSAMCDQDQDSSTNTDIGGTDRARMNKDIDYTRTVNNPLTLDVNFMADGVPTADEEDVISLARNLYWPRAFAVVEKEDIEKNYQVYLQARRHAAMLAVAHNSYVSIVGERSSAVDELGADSGWAYMKSMLREFGIDDNNDDDSDEEIHAYLGDNPSYYAQMEVLTKKLYQHPQFYTNLYDKPVNVERINASMDAISLMHNRDRFEAALRREMLGSLLVERALQRHQEGVNIQLFGGMKESQN